MRILRCLNCREEFSSREARVVRDPHDGGTESYNTCPFCHSESVAEVAQPIVAEARDVPDLAGEFRKLLG